MLSASNFTWHLFMSPGSTPEVEGSTPIEAGHGLNKVERLFTGLQIAVSGMSSLLSFFARQATDRNPNEVNLSTVSLNSSSWRLILGLKERVFL